MKGICSQADLVELGRSLGTIVPTPNGEIVKEIRRIPQEQAPKGSQSAIYGAGSFPLHTDTVFWATPVRYVILRGYGDTRRPTTVMSFANLIKHCIGFASLATGSIWLVRAGKSRFYCSMKFTYAGTECWRYDPDLMVPVNEAALQVDKIFRPLVTSGQYETITWSGDTAVVISNWTALHGRGPKPELPEEGERVIERLYVR